jgi:hypothetical protein
MFRSILSNAERFARSLMLSRRGFLKSLGKGALGVAALGYLAAFGHADRTGPRGPLFTNCCCCTCTCSPGCFWVNSQNGSCTVANCNNLFSATFGNCTAATPFVSGLCCNWGGTTTKGACTNNQNHQCC